MLTSRVGNSFLMKKMLAFLLACVLFLSLGSFGSLFQTDASAEENPSEILLGVFFNSEEDMTDTLYVSTDGTYFFRIGEAFTDSAPSNRDNYEATVSPHLSPRSDRIGEEGWYVNCLHDPGLLYKDGYFWMMSGYDQTCNGEWRFTPMLACSSDLVNWSFPNSGSETNIAPISSALPYDQNGNRTNTHWDTVAPDFMADDDGTVWIIASMGYYAQWHGGSERDDRMSPYLICASNLTPGSTDLTTRDGKGTAPSVTYSDAVPINLPVEDSKNRIDGSLTKIDGKYYLSIKEDGITCEIWTIDTLTLESVQNPNNWTLVCDNVATGYEGPCLTKFQGKYFTYADSLADYAGHSSTGIREFDSSSLSEGWSGREMIAIGMDESGNSVIIPTRHGSVITITDPAAIAQIMKLYNAVGYSDLPDMDDDDSYPEYPGADRTWVDENGKQYWYEGGIRQGTYFDQNGVMGDGTVRGREIYDPASEGWYWLDAIYDGAKAVNKEVWMPYIYQDEANWTEDEIWSNANASDEGMAQQVHDAILEGSGKWVRYDADGKMFKGWCTIEGDLASIYPDQEGNTYYYDYKTGLMAKGWLTINGTQYYFDEVTGALSNDIA